MQHLATGVRNTRHYEHFLYNATYGANSEPITIKPVVLFARMNAAI